MSRRPTVVCRSSQAKEPVEWQADFYASCLLMPRKLVMAAWDEMFPDRQAACSTACACRSSTRLSKSRDVEWQFGRFDRSDADDDVLDAFARRLPSSSSFRRSPCASGWRSSACCIAKFRVSASLTGGAWLFF